MRNLRLTRGMENLLNTHNSYVHNHNEALLDLSLGVLNPQDQTSKYSDPDFTELKEAIGDLFQMGSSHISLGAGIDSTLEILPQIFEGDIVVSTPEFPRFREVGLRNCRNIFEILRDQSDNFAFGNTIVEKIADEMQGIQKIVFVSTPNNPTGQILSIDATHRLADIAEQGHLLVIDMAYGEFAGIDYVRSIADLASQRENVIALLTFSKARGLAGKVRIGYGISSQGIAGLIEKYRLPFIPSGEDAAISSIRNSYELEKVIVETDKKREAIENIVVKNPRLDIVRNGKTNTVLIRGIELDVSKYLLERGIKTSPHPWIQDSREILGYTRITLGSWDAVTYLGNALAEA